MALLTKITKMVEIAKNGAHNIVPLLLESQQPILQQTHPQMS
jgi:hypothetical protein